MVSCFSLFYGNTTHRWYMSILGRQLVLLTRHLTVEREWLVQIRTCAGHCNPSDRHLNPGVLPPEAVGVERVSDELEASAPSYSIALDGPVQRAE